MDDATETAQGGRHHSGMQIQVNHERLGTSSALRPLN